ncbi:replicative DNA helicase [Natronincola ferrireducens]|uniref:DNA 5'-3' helicase n=1 Tax=Natronincola ferrireducens TaxID=393762 RepID=A0A1G9I2W5_9FIRM|nr:replicative DNA helicase [Natronincola ferrireducens]SDL19571.1 replicative DNA helicase [Natronincola ferrireducens]
MQLPHSAEAEQAVLGAFLLDKNTWFGIQKLKNEDFYIDIHQIIFQAMKNLHEKDQPIDYIQVFEETKNIKPIDLVYLNETLSMVATTINIEYYIKILKEKAVRRQLIQECKSALNRALKTEEDPTSIKSNLAQTLDNISFEESQVSDRLQDIFSKLYDELETYDPKEAEKYYTGLPDLDRLMAGLHQEEVTVVAARPATGKTAFALQIAMHIAAKKLKVLLISREMSQKQMAKRILAAKCAIDSMRLRNRKLEDEDWSRIAKGMGLLSNLSLFINTTAKSIPEIKAKVRETKADVLIIDYLQLLEPSSKNANREQQVSELSREIKNISLDYKIPVVLLSQLNRAADGRRPSLADLRESGAIEQDANNVIFLHLPNRNEIEAAVKDKDSIVTDNLIEQIKKRQNKLVEVILAKQRDGNTGDFYMEYVPSKLTFKSYTRR